MGPSCGRSRRLAPNSSGQQLFEIVILAAEFPWDAATAKEAAQQVFGGDRDRAREKRYGPFLDEMVDEVTPPETVPDRVAEIRASLMPPTSKTEATA